jgi:hypothetical protein
MLAAPKIASEMGDDALNVVYIRSQLRAKQ